MKNITYLLLFFVATIWIGCKEDEEVPPACVEISTDSEANISDFLGLWYEIATLPQPFTNDCSCTTAQYSVDSSGVSVFNRCILPSGDVNEIRGTATQPNPDDFSKLKVNFPFIPVPGDYWIIEFGTGGTHMLVGDPALENLFILSRTPTMDNATYDALVKTAEDMCFPVENLAKTTQDGC